MKQKLEKQLFKKNANTYIWIQKKQTQKINKNESIIHIHFPVYIYCN